MPYCESAKLLKTEAGCSGRFAQKPGLVDVLLRAVYHAVKSQSKANIGVPCHQHLGSGHGEPGYPDSYPPRILLKMVENLGGASPKGEGFSLNGTPALFINHSLVYESCSHVLCAACLIWGIIGHFAGTSALSLPASPCHLHLEATPLWVGGSLCWVKGTHPTGRHFTIADICGHTWKTPPGLNLSNAATHKHMCVDCLTMQCTET